MLIWYWLIQMSRSVVKEKKLLWNSYLIKQKDVKNWIYQQAVSHHLVGQKVTNRVLNKSYVLLSVRPWLISVGEFRKESSKPGLAIMQLCKLRFLKGLQLDSQLWIFRRWDIYRSAFQLHFSAIDQPTNPSLVSDLEISMQ